MKIRQSQKPNVILNFDFFKLIYFNWWFLFLWFYFLIILDNDTFETEERKDEYVFLDYLTKMPNEKEFLKRIIANLQQSNKKVCVERQEVVKNNTLTTIRYLAYNGN